MKTENIQIFIDRLSNEGEFTQTGTFPGSFLELKETDLEVGEIAYNVKAYLTDEHLIVNFDTSCTLKLPCKICNELTPFTITCDNQIHLESLEEVKKGEFDVGTCIRETILLNVPPFCECKGNCPERTQLKEFLKEPETYHPFQGL